MSDKESVIREKRTNLAVRNNLMGPAGKFGRILEAFGTPIIRQGSGMMDVNYLDDPYDDEVYTEYGSTMSGQNGPVSYRDQILDSEDEFIVNEGLMFDGLSRGMHLEIVYWHDANEIKASYRGYPVYKEVAGELFGYAPFPEWENQVDRLYAAAKEKLAKTKKIIEQETRELIQKKKHSFWQEMRMRWGELMS